MPRESAERIASLFKALGDPARVEIVNRLSLADEVCVCDFTSALGLSQPTVSHHLKILREAGLIGVERRGIWAYYHLRQDAIEQLGGLIASPS